LEVARRRKKRFFYSFSAKKSLEKNSNKTKREVMVLVFSSFMAMAT
jgi:hypothetical protein